MRIVIWLCLSFAVWAQDPPPPAAPPAPAPQAEAAAGDRWITGSIDLGYRWQTTPGGNENVYRSIVDLGSGPKLLDTEFSIVDPKRRWFDRINTHAANWGDDPYTVLSVSARKSGIYDFTSTYRNIAYFNNLPSYANPLLDRGILSSQQTFDTRNRTSAFDLTLRPGMALVPYISYDRGSEYGDGVATFVADQNEYPAPLRSNFYQNNMRAGIRVELNRYHLTIEQGGTTFHESQDLFQSTAVNPGNRGTPYLGTTLYLGELSQASGMSGHSTYTKAMATAQPATWVSLYGQYLFAQPRIETNYQQISTGNFALQSQALLFNSQQALLSSAANVPHQAGQAGAEIKLHARLRLVTNWLTDRIQTSGWSSGQINLGAGSASASADLTESTALRNDYNHVEADLLWDATTHLMLRGGYRYEWGISSSFLMPPAGLASQDAPVFRRNVGKGGFAYRRGGKLSLTGDVEASGTNAAYFRTSLNRYQRGSLHASYQASSQLTFSGTFSAIGNQNPAPNINFDYFGMQTSVSVLWNPAAAKKIGFQGTYTRATLRSDITFVIPQTFQPDQSVYRDNSHSVSAMFDLAVPMFGSQAKLSAGGAVFLSSGSRPTNYFQPVGRLMVPLKHGISWISEWAYYGYGESFYANEGFRSHLITTGVRLSR